MKGIFLGYRGTAGQVERIELGWVENNNTLCKENETPDLIYCNDNGFYDLGLNLKNKFPSAKLIFNVLDIPKKYYPEINLEDLKDKLKKADIITTISKFSQDQIKEYLNLNSNIIFNPIKNVANINIKREIDFLYIGRLYEPNKRFSLALQALSLLNINKNQFLIAGPDDPGHGLNYIGCVDDKTLNLLYNKSKILICTTEYGVLGLPPIEAVICGCIPILCKDNPAVQEFKLDNFAFPPNPNEIAKAIMEINKEKLQPEVDLVGKNLFNLLNKNKIAKNIEELI